MRDIFRSNSCSENIQDSFDFLKNKDAILKAGEQGGGASGELFFMTYDKNCMFKTISKSEAAVFKKMIKNYTEHMKENDKTLIGRIYGLLNFKFTKQDTNVSIIVMENVHIIPKHAILRQYDMKGSTHSRHVFKDDYKKFDKKTAFGDVLKDEDFLGIDKGILLSSSQYKYYQSQLIKDVNFFASHNIIDFSLILAVINLEKCSEEEKISLKSNYRILFDQEENCN